MVTIYDIAAKAKVSAMTVSRVINNTGRISDQTREKVKKVMDELGYVPNQMARSLVLQQTRILFLLIPDITNPFYTTLSRGAEDAAKQHGYHLLFGNSDEDLQKEAEYMNTILATRVDGVLLAPTGDPSLPHLEKLQTHRVPFVLIDREVPGIECDVVLGDSKEAAQNLTQHLIAQGHRHIAMINGSSSVSSARLRLEGYTESFRNNGLPIHPSYIFEASFGRQNNINEIKQWLDTLHPFPTGIVAGNNVLAIEILRLLRERGLRVPEDIALVCFDDFGPYSEMDSVMIVAEQQAYQFGFIGMQLLIERIANRDKASNWKKVVLPAELNIKRSM